MKLKMWPKKSERADRDELLELARAGQERAAGRFRESEDQHVTALAEWRETIEARLIAEIPKLARERDEDGSFTHSLVGYHFEAPEEPHRFDVERWGAAIEVLEALPPGEVGMSIREAINRIGGVYMSHD